MITDSNGDVISSHLFGSDIHDYFLKIHATADNSMLVVGKWNDGWQSKRRALKIDQQGNIPFDHELHATSLSGTSKYGMTETADGSYYFSGMNPLVETDSIFLIKINSAGEKIWDKYISSTYDNYANTLLITSPDDQLILLASPLDHNNYVLENSLSQIFKINKDGQLIWEQSINDMGVCELMFDMKNTNDGGLVALGNATVENSVDYYVLKLGPDELNSTLSNHSTESLILYPNPSNDSHLFTYFESNGTGPIEITIFNAIGQQVHLFKEYKTSSRFQKNYQFGKLPPGAYFIRLAANGRSTTSTWIKQ